MNNTKLTNIILILLLAFNVLFLGSWWYGHWKAHRISRHGMCGNPGKGEKFFCRKLNLSSSQQAQYEALGKSHLQKIKSMENEKAEYDIKMMEILIHNPADSARAFLYGDSAGMVKARMMKEMYRHLNDLRMMCTPEQTVEFDSLMKKMTEEFPLYHAGFNCSREQADTTSK
jgi:Spy/CpxP family protein refolding chaperone